MHSDFHTLEHMWVKMNIASISNDSIEVSTIYNPPDSLKSALLNQIILPENLGCGHLKLTVSKPDLYQTQKTLSQNTLQAVFQYMWESNKLFDESDPNTVYRRIEYDILEGNHTEHAVVQVFSTVSHGDCSVSSNRLPMIYPRVDIGISNTNRGIGSIFTQCPPAILSRRLELANFFLQQPFKYKNTPNVTEFTSIQQSLGDLQLSNTLAALASTLPIFNITFKNSRDSISSLMPLRAPIVIAVLAVGVLLVVCCYFVNQRKEDPETQALLPAHFHTDFHTVDE